MVALPEIIGAWAWATQGTRIQPFRAGIPKEIRDSLPKDLPEFIPVEVTLKSSSSSKTLNGFAYLAGGGELQFPSYHDDLSAIRNELLETNNEEIRREFRLLFVDALNECRSTLPEVDRLSLAVQRLRQAKFRSEVMQRFGSICALSGINIVAALDAAHIKPYKLCSQSEKIDPENGMPLSATLHRLYDAELLGFDSQGKLTYDPTIADLLVKQGVDIQSRKPVLSEGQLRYWKQNLRGVAGSP